MGTIIGHKHIKYLFNMSNFMPLPEQQAQIPVTLL